MSSGSRAPVTVRRGGTAALGLALILAACGGATSSPSQSGPTTAASSPSAKATPKPTASPTATPGPTPTVTPEPDPTPTAAPAKDVAATFRIGTPFRLVKLEARLAEYVNPIVEGYGEAFREFGTLGVREILRSGTLEEILVAVKLKSGLISMPGFWDGLIQGVTIRGTLRSTTKSVSGVKVVYVQTNGYALAVFGLTENRAYRNYVIEIVGPSQTKLAAAVAAFIKANN